MYVLQVDESEQELGEDLTLAKAKFTEVVTAGSYEKRVRLLKVKVLGEAAYGPTVVITPRSPKGAGRPRKAKDTPVAV